MFYYWDMEIIWFHKNWIILNMHEFNNKWHAFDYRWNHATDCSCVHQSANVVGHMNINFLIIVRVLFLIVLCVYMFLRFFQTYVNCFTFVRDIGLLEHNFQTGSAKFHNFSVWSQISRYFLVQLGNLYIVLKSTNKCHYVLKNWVRLHICVWVRFRAQC